MQLALLAAAQVMAMTLWVSATAVLPALTAAWQPTPSSTAWVTGAVQLGFVGGALGSALLNLPGLLPPGRLAAAASVLAAAFTPAFAWVVDSARSRSPCASGRGWRSPASAPPGMKIAAGHVAGRRRGLAIGVLVGASTLGSATPRGLAGLASGPTLDYRFVLTTSAVLALLGTPIVAWLVRDGPHQARPAPFDRAQVARILGSKPILLANLGYFGHRWELYAMWTGLAVFVAGDERRPDRSAGGVSVHRGRWQRGGGRGRPGRRSAGSHSDHHRRDGCVGRLLPVEPLGIRALPRAAGTLRGRLGGQDHRGLGPGLGRCDRARGSRVRRHRPDAADQRRLRIDPRPAPRRAVAG